MGQDCTRKDSITVERLQGQLFPSAGHTLANDNNVSIIRIIFFSLVMEIF